MLCYVFYVQNVDEVAGVDKEQVDRPGWEVDDVVSLQPCYWFGWDTYGVVSYQFNKSADKMLASRCFATTQN